MITACGQLPFGGDLSAWRKLTCFGVINRSDDSTEQTVQEVS